MQPDWSFLRAKKSLVLTVVLMLQAMVVYGFHRREVLPQHQVLSAFTPTVGSWQLEQETPVDKETAEVLKADDTLSRSYVSSALRARAHLFVAFFRSQRTGQAPHSPKNCLPGSGWTPTRSDFVSVDIPGRAPIVVNRYIVQRGENRSMVFYWYQSRDRVVASEYSAKFYVVADAIRYNRTDTALVRVVLPMERGDNPDVMEGKAFDFIRAFYAPLRHHFPA